MKKKLLSLMICCIMLTGCEVKPTPELLENGIKSKEDDIFLTRESSKQMQKLSGYV